MIKRGGMLVAMAALVALTSGATSIAPIAFELAVRESGGTYASMSPDAISEMRVHFCGHFEAGYTVQDVVAVQTELFGEPAGEEMRVIAEAAKTSC